jgi:hypothetical protein
VHEPKERPDVDVGEDHPSIAVGPCVLEVLQALDRHAAVQPWTPLQLGSHASSTSRRGAPRSSATPRIARVSSIDSRRRLGSKYHSSKPLSAASRSAIAAGSIRWNQRLA